MSKISVGSEPVASKITFEIRFRPNLNYFNDAFKIASAFEGDFEDWQTSHSPYQAILFSVSDKELMAISSQNIAVVFEGDYSEDALLERINKISQLIIVPTELNEIRRVGVRQIKVFETGAKFDAAATKTAEAFSSNFHELRKLSIDKVEDYAFYLDGIMNGFSNHVKFGPVTPDEAVDRFASSFPNKDPKTDSTSIFLDVDVFKDEVIDTTSLHDSIGPIIAESNRIIDGYAQFITRELAND